MADKEVAKEQVAKKPVYVPTDREQAFLDTVEDTRHQREIINGLTPFFNEKAPEDMNHDHHGGGGNEHMYGGDQGHMEEHS